MSLTIDRLAWASPWRRRALTERAVLGLGLLTLALALPPWPGAAMVLVAAWGLALGGARIPPGAWIRLNAAPLGFVLTGACALAFSLDGDGIHFSPDGARAALAVILRASAAAASLLLLASVTPTPELLAGLRRLGLAPELAELMLLIWRFIFLLLEEAAAMRHAQEARLGWHGPGRAIRSLGLLIAQLLPRALERARRMEMGLAARGMEGGLPATRPGAPASPFVMAGILAGFSLLTGACLWLA